MDKKLVAVIVDTSTRLASFIMNNRNKEVVMPTPPDPADFRVHPDKIKLVGLPGAAPAPSLEPEQFEAPVEVETEDDPSSIKAGCIPCAIGHYGACTGTINEAVRFASAEGIDSPEVVARTGACLDELNALERWDLRPQKIVAIESPWERELAQDALDESRSIRHALEGLTSPEELIAIAAQIQTMRQKLGQQWVTNKTAEIQSRQEEVSDDE